MSDFAQTPGLLTVQDATWGGSFYRRLAMSQLEPFLCFAEAALLAAPKSKDKGEKLALLDPAHMLALAAFEDARLSSGSAGHGISDPSFHVASHT